MQHDAVFPQRKRGRVDRCKPTRLSDRLLVKGGRQDGASVLERYTLNVLHQLDHADVVAGGDRQIDRVHPAERRRSINATLNTGQACSDRGRRSVALRRGCRIARCARRWRRAAVGTTTTAAGQAERKKHEGQKVLAHWIELQLAHAEGTLGGTAGLTFCRTARAVPGYYRAHA